MGPFILSQENSCRSGQPQAVPIKGMMEGYDENKKTYRGSADCAMGERHDSWQ
ncbi:hypothetical protein LCGC14_3012000, partial [marine sediment metagenome]